MLLIWLLVGLLGAFLLGFGGLWFGVTGTWVGCVILLLAIPAPFFMSLPEKQRVTTPVSTWPTLAKTRCWYHGEINQIAARLPANPDQIPDPDCLVR